jgi:hypothetical protein
MAAQSLAEAMAGAYRDQKILLATLDIAGEEYWQVRGERGLESLRAAMGNGVLTGAALKGAAFPHAGHPNLFMLRGPATHAARRDFFPEHMEALLRAASEEFGVFIIDAGANLQTGLAIGVLSKSDLNVLVTTQQEHAFVRYSQRKRDLLDPLGITLSYLVLNKYAGISPLGSLNSIKERYGVEKGAAIPWSDFGWQAEKEAESLLSFGDRDFERGAGAFLADIAAFCGFPPPGRRRGALRRKEGSI